MTTIVWFRNDLRLADNPALTAAVDRGAVLPLFILEEEEGVDDLPRRRGGAGRWWLHHSLERLARDLGGLLLLRGDPRRLLPALAERTGARAVYWNRRYHAAGIALDRALKADLTARGLETRSFNAALLVEPWAMTTQSGGPYRVFTPFWRAAGRLPVSAPLSAPDGFDPAPLDGIGDRLEDWALAPTRPNWAAGWEEIWQPGERGARNRLETFVGDGLADYGEDRDRPDRKNVSRLSAALQAGNLSPRQILDRLKRERDARPDRGDDIEAFTRQLYWREFSHHLLFHFPDLARHNWRPAFDAYPWRVSPPDLAAWQRGATGYPLIDAGLRELWQTGYMHNRLRMLTASFLTKHLRLDWRLGEAWFWDTLVDADEANNAAGWQWVAGSGADAAPYFRIFNPVSQGGKFDPDGAYVRRWCPELTALPTRDLFAPFAARAETLRDAGVRLGETYPHPLVDHAQARAAALAGYDAVKRASSSEG